MMEELIIIHNVEKIISVQTKIGEVRKIGNYTMKIGTREELIAYAENNNLDTKKLTEWHS